jgi:hypothetical protein
MSEVIKLSESKSLQVIETGGIVLFDTQAPKENETESIYLEADATAALRAYLTRQVLEQVKGTYILSTTKPPCAAHLLFREGGVK